MQKHPIRKIIILIIIGIAILILLSLLTWFWQNGRLTLALPKDAHSVQIIRQSNGEKVTDDNIANKDSYQKILPSGKYEVRITSEDRKKESVYFGEVPQFLGSMHRDVALHNQSQREKIGRGSLQCPVLSGEKLYSYECSGADTIQETATLSIDTPEPQEVPVGTIVSAESYRDGILTLLHLSIDGDVPGTLLTFIKDGKIISEKEVPGPAPTNQRENLAYKFQIDPSNPERFIVAYNDYQDVYLYNSLESEPVRIDLPTDIAIEGRVSSMDLSNNILTIGTGSVSDGHGEESDDGVSGDTTAYIYQFKLDKNSVVDSKEYRVENLSFDAIKLCATGFLCTSHESSTAIYKINGDQLEKTTTLNDVTEEIIKINNTHFAYIRNEQLYIYNTKSQEARLAYFSNNFRTSTITNSPKGLILNAYLNQEGPDSADNLYSFLVSTEQPAAQNTFIDEVLPYAPGSIDGAVLDSDYYKDTVVIQVALDSWESPVRVSGGGASDYTYNQEEFDQKKQKILEQLEKDGITPDKYNIQIKP